MLKVVTIITALSLLSLSVKSDLVLPEKYIGSYIGVQEAYKIQVGGNELMIPAIKYELIITPENIWLSTQDMNRSASYTTKKETKKYIPIVVRFDNGSIEEWQVWKKGKRIIRNTDPPRPTTVFSLQK